MAVLSDSTSRDLDVVSPCGFHFTVRHVQVIEDETIVPVQVRDIITIAT